MRTFLNDRVVRFEAKGQRARASVETALIALRQAIEDLRHRRP